MINLSNSLLIILERIKQNLFFELYRFQYIFFNFNLNITNFFSGVQERKMKMVSWMWKGSSKQADEVNEDELKKKGFDPQGLQIEESQQEPIVDFNADYEGYITPTPEEAQQLINNYKFFENEGDHRHEFGHPSGGKICGNKKQVSKIRSIGKEMIKLIGKKMISGDLNLTRISFPIKAMVPKTALENSTMAACTMPYFMKRAVESKDPVQRMKYVMSAVFSGFYYINLFLKPLNPVIGETLQGRYPDGTKLYCEQISHHPPVSYFLVVGPNQSYRYYGYYAFSAHAGLNSMTLVNKGKRFFEFKNGEQISVDFNKEIYSGVFLGSLRSEAVDAITFKDLKNKVETTVKFGKVKKRPSDYFTGQITKNGKKASTYDGTYCGYLNFDDVRYWDGRFMKPFRIIFEEKCLESDFMNRNDVKLLRQGRLTEAQQAKEEIEVIQRKDVKMRELNKEK